MLLTVRRFVGSIIDIHKSLMIFNSLKLGFEGCEEPKFGSLLKFFLMRVACGMTFHYYVESFFFGFAHFPPLFGSFLSSSPKLLPFFLTKHFLFSILVLSAFFSFIKREPNSLFF